MNAFKNQNMLFIRTNSYENYGKEKKICIHFFRVFQQYLLYYSKAVAK